MRSSQECLDTPHEEIRQRPCTTYVHVSHVTANMTKNRDLKLAKQSSQRSSGFLSLLKILLRAAAGAGRLSDAVGVTQLDQPPPPPPYVLERRSRCLTLSLPGCPDSGKPVNNLQWRDLLAPQSPSPPPPPAEEADRRSRNILGIRTLGATRLSDYVHITKFENLPRAEEDIYSPIGRSGTGKIRFVVISAPSQTKLPLVLVYSFSRCANRNGGERSGLIFTSGSSEQMRVKREQRWNTRAGETGDPRGNPPTRSILTECRLEINIERGKAHETFRRWTNVICQRRPYSRAKRWINFGPTKFCYRRAPLSPWCGDRGRGWPHLQHVTALLTARAARVVVIALHDVRTQHEHDSRRGRPLVPDCAGLFRLRLWSTSQLRGSSSGRLPPGGRRRTRDLEERVTGRGNLHEPGGSSSPEETIRFTRNHRIDGASLSFFRGVPGGGEGSSTSTDGEPRSARPESLGSTAMTTTGTPPPRGCGRLKRRGGVREAGVAHTGRVAAPPPPPLPFSWRSSHDRSGALIRYRGHTSCRCPLQCSVPLHTQARLSSVSLHDLNSSLETMDYQSSTVQGPWWFSEWTTRLLLGRIGFDSRQSYPRILTCGNRTARSRWWWVVWGISCFSRFIIPALLHTHLSKTLIGSQDHARSSATKTNRVQSPAGSSDLRMWESCRTMPLAGGFSRGSPVSPALSFLRCFILTSVTFIDSEDLAVNSRQNLFTHSHHIYGPSSVEPTPPPPPPAPHDQPNPLEEEIQRPGRVRFSPSFRTRRRVFMRIFVGYEGELSFYTPILPDGKSGCASADRREQTRTGVPRQHCTTSTISCNYLLHQWWLSPQIPRTPPLVLPEPGALEEYRNMEAGKLAENRQDNCIEPALACEKCGILWVFSGYSPLPHQYIPSPLRSPFTSRISVLKTSAVKNEKGVPRSCLTSKHIGEKKSGTKWICVP
ncbi:hypothetical protein PR048_003235 [Dryococelus australis]|uniref:Uncharacterized protein n=1 Tax=Dryococelus australis TaxID=614101 RepID=A0ABQ9IPN0_9NEOP|nr:hypothetical protein PR048_003235 [Dryococelus australis]